MAIGGYDENMRKGHEDWEFFIRLLDENSLVYQIPSPLFYYRVKEQSMITAAKQADVFNETEFYIYSKHRTLYASFLEAVHCTSFANCFICARSARRIEINGIEDFPSIYKRTFSQMKLSVITINYNNAEGLAKTMDSVFRQRFSDFEYIVIDGGSTDGSKDLIVNNQDKIAYWCSEKIRAYIMP